MKPLQLAGKKKNLLVILLNGITYLCTCLLSLAASYHSIQIEEFLPLEPVMMIAVVQVTRVDIGKQAL